MLISLSPSMVALMAQISSETLRLTLNCVMSNSSRGMYSLPIADPERVRDVSMRGYRFVGPTDPEREREASIGSMMYVLPHTLNHREYGDLDAAIGRNIVFCPGFWEELSKIWSGSYI